MPKKMPIQPAGWVVLGVGVASVVGAFALHWRELLVLAVGCVLILALSLLFIIGRSEVLLTRTLKPSRVTVGDPAIVELHAVNTSNARSPRRTIQEAFDGQPVPIVLPVLRPGQAATRTWEPPTDRRGRYRLGPARITKADPCRLMMRDVSQTDVDELWVQPRVVPLPAFGGGPAKDMDGPTFDHSPAGDVAFHAIRPYRMGDDVRHVHWMATARAGEMMVRHYVDNRQPYLSVLIDTNEASWTSPDEFDHALDIAASLGVASLERAQPLSVHVGDRTIVGRQHRSTRQQLLDDLTLAATEPLFDLTHAMSRLIAAERNTSIAVLLTGSGDSLSRLAPASAKLSSRCEVVLVRVGPGSDEELIVGRGVQLISVDDVDDFRALTTQRLVRL